MKKYLKVFFLLIISSFLFPVKAKVILEDDFLESYELERAYIVGNYIFDLGRGFNPTLKDLLIASSYNEQNTASVYEVKFSPNIDGEMVKEYQELLSNQKLDEFPSIDVKYIYESSIDKVDASFYDIDSFKKLEYGNSVAKKLTEEEFDELNINRCYVVGEYLFNLDEGYNPSLEDLLKASPTFYTNQVTIYEIKKSENIKGELIVEYNELLSGKKLEEFPDIKVRYVYDHRIDGTPATVILPFYDVVEFSDVTKEYTASPIVIDTATSENQLPIRYEFYSSTTCSGDKLENGAIDVGKYGVKAISVGNNQVLSDHKCRILTVVPMDASDSETTILDSSIVYTGKAIEPSFHVVKNGITLIPNKDYDYSYSNNIYVGDGVIDLTFKGNYKGSKQFTFTIFKKKIELYSSDNQKVYDGAYFEIDDPTYCNLKNGFQLGSGDLIGNCHVKSNGKVVGEHNIQILSYKILKGNIDVTSNYDVSLSDGVDTITSRNISCTINPKNKIYNSLKLDVRLECDNVAPNQVEKSLKTLPTLVNVQDSTIFSLEKTDIQILDGEEDVTSNYTVNISNGGLIPLRIIAKSADRNPKIIVTLEYDHASYDGLEKKPRILRIYDEELGVDLNENESYNYSYFNNVNQGTGEVRIVFKGNYEGERTATFVIE